MSVSADRRGTRLNIKVVPSAGWRDTFTFKDKTTGNPIDITGRTYTLTLSDGKQGGSADYRSQSALKPTYEQDFIGEIVGDPVNGQVYLEIPKSFFADKWGEQIIYSLTHVTNGEAPVPTLYGVFEAESLK